MSTASAKPVIFISYSHKDEPEHPRDGEVQWLSFVRSYLQPAVKHGIVQLWVDHHIPGGADWTAEIEEKLLTCDIFILLISTNSLASDYIVDKEIRTIRERQANRDQVHFYPILLTPTPDIALDKVRDKNLRPANGRPLSSFSYNDRLQQMVEIANEIGRLAKAIREQKPTPSRSMFLGTDLVYVNIAGLPETPYERLVGREDQLKALDDTWNDSKINIISLIAEGGAGKSALVNEWLLRLQRDGYRGAEMVLGWSFYSQGTKERVTSAEQFLNWAIEKLGINVETTSASARGDQIAEALMRRRILLVLDGVEPLQHGLDTRFGELKDRGLRALLRRFASTSPLDLHGLVVLTSRLPARDIGRWKDSAPVMIIEQLNDEAGAALLRDNGVWGTEKQLNEAARDFGGHPLALGLLASFLAETQTGDVRRRDRIRGLLEDTENPGHDHARRVMESFERDWLAGQPVLLTIMHMIGLFDRPASRKCLYTLRRPPAIEGLTDNATNLDDRIWQRAIARLREGRLLSPNSASGADELDAHPLVREWFGERLRATNEVGYRSAHGRLYEFLRDTTEEGKRPQLEELAPLYQAIFHGCLAGRYNEALSEIFEARICKNTSQFGAFYARTVLGAFGADLAAISNFFDRPYDKPAPALLPIKRAWALNDAAHGLMAQGRLFEALPALHEAFKTAHVMGNRQNAMVYLSNCSEAELLQGRIDSATKTAKDALHYAAEGRDQHSHIGVLANLARALHAAGLRSQAEQHLIEAERLQQNYQAIFPILYSEAGYTYCDLLLDKDDLSAVQTRALQTLEWARAQGYIRDVAFDTLTLGRVATRIALDLNGAPHIEQRTSVRQIVDTANTVLETALEGLRSSGQLASAAIGLMGRATFLRTIGDWNGAVRNLDEVEEIAEPGPMRLFLCDIALERARLAFAKIEAFAPLNGMMEKGNPPKPTLPSANENTQLKEEAEKQIKIVADYIEKCGYHRRDEELAELQAVLRGERTFASLPPRV